MMIYLASQSPRRKEILKKLGLRFQIIKSNYVEKHRKALPAKLVLEHAVGKAKGAVGHAAKSGVILGADTLVYARGKVLGKPKTADEAVRMLEWISGRAHSVYTGVALMDAESGVICKGVDRTRVYVRKMTKPEILKYMKKAKSLDKAGAYAIQVKPSIVKKIEGSYSNVVGLPEELLLKLLKRCKKQDRGRR